MKGQTKRDRSVSHVSPTPAKSAVPSSKKVPKTDHHTAVAPAAVDGGQNVDPVTLTTPYITLDQYIRQLMSDPDNKVGDPGDCPLKTCPYCTGGMMLQRFLLVKKLVQIENALYRSRV